MAENKSPSGLLERGLDAGLHKVEFDPAEHGMAPLSLQVLVPGQPCPADLFLALYDRQTKSVKMQHACSRGEEFRAKWRDNLIKAEQHRVYIRLEEAQALTDYYDRFVGEILSDPNATSRKKALVVQEMASLNLRMFFATDLDPKDTEKAVSRAEETVNWMARDPALLRKLSDVLKSDYSLYSHSVNVSMLSMAFGRFLKLGEDRIHLLGMGGLLHDIGMAKISKELLRKTGSLELAEMEVVKKHPYQGYQTLMNVAAVPYPVLRIVLHHHEKADGSGYPNRLKGTNIPYLARLTSLVDAYDAMTSERPYHEPVKPFAAATSLAEATTDKFGKELILAFIRFLGSPFVAG